jgi:hypothetical protein
VSDFYAGGVEVCPECDIADCAHIRERRRKAETHMSMKIEPERGEQVTEPTDPMVAMMYWHERAMDAERQRDEAREALREAHEALLPLQRFMRAYCTVKLEGITGAALEVISQRGEDWVGEYNAARNALARIDRILAGDAEQYVPAETVARQVERTRKMGGGDA